MLDNGAFIRDAEPYRRELLAHCYRMLGSVHDAEDAVQETFVRAWRSYDGFEGRASLRTWLYQIATNRCLTELAGSRRRRVLPSGLGEPDLDPAAEMRPADAGVSWVQPLPDALVTADSADPGAIATMRAGLRLALVASWQYLPPRQRAVLILRDVLAFPAAEVAEMLGISTAAVKSLLQRGRTHLEALDLTDTAIAEPTAAQALAILDQYIRAFEAADADVLEHLLVRDATLEATPLRNWFAGRATCITFLRDHLLGVPGTWRMLPTTANGQPAAAAYISDGHGRYQSYGICVLTVTEGGIDRISSFGDPSSVAAFGFPATIEGAHVATAAAVEV